MAPTLFVVPIALVSPAFVIIFVVIVILLIRWQVKFGGLQVNDADYHAARSSLRTSLIAMIVAFPPGFGVRPLVQAVFYSMTDE